ncbi:MAG: DUF4384 domain-containing protein [Gammaproteobacteria bacterium]|nr:DUF4384 domain-containing protein [Gammaproteobacteria bacterium]
MLKYIEYLVLAILFFSIIASAGIGKNECVAGQSNTIVKSIKDTSFKSFIKQVTHNYGKQYASHVEELFHVLLKSEKDILSEKGPRFLEFDVIKMRETAGEYTTAIIKSGNMISVRDKCKMSFTPRERCYIYAFKVETTVKIFPLFPRKKFSQQTNSLTPNLTYFVPPMKKWLPFDKGYGEEAIILSAFLEGSYDIEKLMKYFNTFSANYVSPANEKIGPVNAIPITNKGISGDKKSEYRKLRLPFDKLGKFMATEYIWEGSKFVKTLWYKRK